MPSEKRDSLSQGHAVAKLGQDAQDPQLVRPVPDDSKAVRKGFPMEGSPRGG